MKSMQTRLPRGLVYFARPCRAALWGWAVVVACVSLIAGANEANTPATVGAAASPVGLQVDDFTLRDFYGKSYTLSEYAAGQPVAIVFLGVECPLAKVYAPRLEKLAQELAPRGVKLLGINANQQDSITEIAAYARTHGVTFPLLKDPGNTVADQMRAERTPQAFLLDGQRVVRYCGRIDDQYGFQTGLGYARPNLTKRDLVEAALALVSGEPIDEPLTQAPGCLIGRVRQPDPSATVTYSNQISRVLQKHCVECHRSGEIAPFALTSYEEAAGWAPMIEEVVEQRRMPPWHADPRYGHFLNDRSLSDEERSQIAAWVKAGAPEGDPSLLPPPREFPQGWHIGTPDQIVYMSDKPHPIQAEGEIPYQYFVVDPEFKEDKWLKATECQMGNRSVVHHIFVFAQHPGSAEIDTEALNRGASEGPDSGLGDQGMELISGAAPGTPPFIHPDGMAMYVPAGSKLVFQMHYTANGTETSDISCVGFKFADPATVRYRSKMGMAINFAFRIPAQAANHPVESSHTFEKDSLILNFAPHMHLRGKSFRYELQYPDGKREVILDVPRYDFNWQVIYSLKEPKYVPAGTKMHCLAHFDNSSENLANPNPDEEVKWGDQTWEEMMIGWFESTSDFDTGLLPEDQNRTARFRRDLAEQPPTIGKLLSKWAGESLKSDRAFEKFARKLIKEIPQLDRVDVAFASADGVEFERVYQAAVFSNLVGCGSGAVHPGKTLTAAAAASQPTSLADLTVETAEDLKPMQRSFRSSYHVPVAVNGRSAVVSFWSVEKQAFPAEATQVLEAVARLVK